MMRVLIAGCGYVGTALGLELSTSGHTTFGLRRDPSVLPQEIQPVAADLSNPQTLGSMPKALDAIVYMASPSERSDAGYKAAYVDGLRNLLEHASAPRLLLVTSTAVYAQSDGSWVDERSPTAPTHFSGKRLLEAEALAASSGVQAASVRLAGIYGPSRNRLIRNVQAGKPIAIHGGRFGNRIHRDDCAGMLHHLLVLDALEPVYIGVDHAPVPLAETYGWIAEQLGLPAPVFEPPVRPSGRGASNKRCRNARLLESGYVFRYPTYREGYGDMLGILHARDRQP